MGDQKTARVEQYADARITSINRLDILPFQLEMRPSLTEDDLCQSWRGREGSTIVQGSDNDD